MQNKIEQSDFYKIGYKFKTNELHLCSHDNHKICSELKEYMIVGIEKMFIDKHKTEKIYKIIDIETGSPFYVSYDFFNQ